MSNISQKYCIVATKNGTPMGYVRSVSLVKGSFSLIGNKPSAKKYSSLDLVMGDIDKLTAIGMKEGFVFIYDIV